MTEPHTPTPPPHDVADYCRDIAEELAVLARHASLPTLADALERAREIASAASDGMATEGAKRASG